MGDDVQDSGAPDKMGDDLGRAPLAQSPDAAGNVLTVPAVSPKEEDDLKAMRDKALRALAGRGDRANSDPIPLLGDPEDLEFNLVFADVGSEVQDYFRDALGQTVQETRAEYTDDGELVQAAVMVRHTRLWPAMEILANKHMIVGGVLPKVATKDDPDVGSYAWKGKPAHDLAFVASADDALLQRIVNIACEYYMSDDRGKAVDDYMGNLQKRLAGGSR